MNGSSSSSSSNTTGIGAWWTALGATSSWSGENATLTSWSGENTTLTSWSGDNATLTSWSGENATLTSWSGENAALTTWSGENATTGDPAEDARWRAILGNIRQSFLPIVVAGTITNCLNFVVLSHREMRGFSTAVYLLALAIADLGVMYFELLRVWFEWTEIVSDPQVYFTDTYCRLVNYANGVVRDFSNWLIACLTAERLVMVASPYRAKTLCTTRVAKTVTVVLLVVIAVPHGHELVFSRAQYSIWWVCWEDRSSALAKRLGAAVEFVVGYVVVVIVFVLNMVLIYFIYRNRMPSAPSSMSNLTSYKRKSHNRRLTRTLLLVAVVFLVCETPRVMMTFVFKFIEKTPIRRIFLNASFLLSGINHATNFFIYIFSSPRFRHLLFERLPVIGRCSRVRSRRRRRRRSRGCVPAAGATAAAAAAVDARFASDPGPMFENTQGDEDTCVQISLNVFVSRHE